MRTYTLGALVALGLLIGAVILACVAYLPAHAKRTSHASLDNLPATVVAHHSTQHSIGPCGPFPCRNDRSKGG